MTEIASTHGKAEIALEEQFHGRLMLGLHPAVARRKTQVLAWKKGRRLLLSLYSCRQILQIFIHKICLARRGLLLI